MKYEVAFSHANIEEIYKFNHVAKQANGSVWLQEGNTVILATVVVDTHEESNEDFLPLTVQYIEKAYAAGRIPGGFIKRESKPSDFETLTSRIIDRSLRPLFPKGFSYPVQITVMVLSTDEKADLQRIALNAASAALFASDIPVTRSVSAQRLTKLDGEFVINPTKEQLKEGTLDLYLAGTKEELLMIEMRSLGTQTQQTIELPLIDPMLDPSLALQMIEVQNDNVIDEAELIEAIALLQASIFEANLTYEEAFLKISKKKLDIVLKAEDDHRALNEFIQKNYLQKIQDALEPLAKSERSFALKAIVKEVLNSDYVKENQITKDVVDKVVNEIKRNEVRSQILDKNIRADGRKLNEVRPISIETNILPQSHASVLFTRGQTQALAALTLGTSHDSQMYQELTESSTQYENLMIHYNFPGFSVGEVSRIGPAGRRELGHGNLAKRAIEPTFDNSANQTVRIVSEILESNGSSSMATVCAASLAMKAANITTTNLVAGVAMGLVTEGDRYAVLTDIMGLEDHDGDMDFKITGTSQGVSALQMDIKLGGISLEVLTKAFAQAKEARMHILGIMEDTYSTMESNEGVLPTTEHFIVDPSRIVDIIGQAGKTIREIIEKFDVAIDLDKVKGNVKISSRNKDNIAQAKEHIKSITTSIKKEYEVGDEVEGKVKKIMDFGAFIELPEGQDGLLHISKISDERISHPSEAISEGDTILVRISGFKGKKIELERQ